MNRGKASVSSNCEKLFTLEAIKERKRLDGRSVYDYRHVTITPSPVTHGNVLVTLGDTRVQACIDCEVTMPRPQRPTDGLVYFNVMLSPMASPDYEISSRSPLTIKIERLLDRCFKESRSIDTESLCIIAGQKVWSVRVDLHVLNDTGNITDCCVLASLLALKHFKRPDVTVSGEEAVIHPISEREPVPLNIHHTPICVTFGFCHDGDYLLVDPSLEEEKVLSGHLSVVMNTHKEICTMQLEGGVALDRTEVARCTKIAMTKVNELDQLINKSLLNRKTTTSGDDDNGLSILTSRMKKSSQLIINKIKDIQKGEDDEELDSVDKELIQEVQEGVSEIPCPMEGDGEEVIEKTSSKSSKAASWEEENDSEEEAIVTLTDIGGFTGSKEEANVRTRTKTCSTNNGTTRSGNKGKKRRKRN